MGFCPKVGAKLLLFYQIFSVYCEKKVVLGEKSTYIPML